MSYLILSITLTLLGVEFVTSFAQPPKEIPKWLSLLPGTDSTNFLADPMPEIPMNEYSPGMWEPNWFNTSMGRFNCVWSYPDSFVLSWTVPSSEPGIGYPYHYGNLVGVNDTIKVRVFFECYLNPLESPRKPGDREVLIIDRLIENVLNDNK